MCLSIPIVIAPACPALVAQSGCRLCHKLARTPTSKGAAPPCHFNLRSLGHYVFYLARQIAAFAYSYGNAKQWVLFLCRRWHIAARSKSRHRRRIKRRRRRSSGKRGRRHGIVQRLQILCPLLSKVKLAQILAVPACIWPQTLHLE